MKDDNMFPIPFFNASKFAWPDMFCPNFFGVQYSSPRKLTWQWKTTMNEDVFPVENGDFPLLPYNTPKNQQWNLKITYSEKRNDLNQTKPPFLAGFQAFIVFIVFSVVYFSRKISMATPTSQSWTKTCNLPNLRDLGWNNSTYRGEITPVKPICFWPFI